MADFERPPANVESARDAEERWRFDTENAWAARLDAEETTRAPLVWVCPYGCGRVRCSCTVDWRVNAVLNGDEP